MALRNQNTIHPKWAYHNRDVARSLSLATVQIYNPSSGEKVYDEEENTWTGDDVILYTGPARIQAPGSQQDILTNFNPTLVQQVKIFIPYNKNTLEDSDGIVPNISTGDKVVVTGSPYDASLEGFIFTVINSLTSSNPWEKTLFCRTDVELDRTAVDNG